MCTLKIGSICYESYPCQHPFAIYDVNGKEMMYGTGTARTIYQVALQYKIVEESIDSIEIKMHDSKQTVSIIPEEVMWQKINMEKLKQECEIQFNEVYISNHGINYDMKYKPTSLNKYYNIYFIFVETTESELVNIKIMFDNYSSIAKTHPNRSGIVYGNIKREKLNEILKQCILV